MAVISERYHSPAGCPVVVGVVAVMLLGTHFIHLPAICVRIIISDVTNI